MAMKPKLYSVVALVAVLGVSVATLGFDSGERRSDCPGKIRCPINGEEICKDQCPLIDAARSDCPGKVECPLTGELVCRDQCPLEVEEETVKTEKELPACCRAKRKPGDG